MAASRQINQVGFDLFNKFLLRTIKSFPDLGGPHYVWSVKTID